MFLFVELIRRIGSLKMERFFKHKLSHETTTESPKEGASNSPREHFSSTSVRKTIVDLNSVPSDPAQKNNISECHPNQVDEIIIA
ncbi:zinc finger MYM-type protein 1-like [Iris pallida]|uniref:Zinc finger MYM-type protein 1-like n=1 Tax=Iris pallida TaxID=29817 RepID=A0AAX6IJN5_IRIPA|nr:zinc finger MYM-type protein 1-like [Iris pallida]